MSRLKTFADGGVILPTDLNNIEDDYECAFGTYKESLMAGGLSLSGAGALTTTPALFSLYSQIGGAFSPALLYLDPALYWTDAATESGNPRTVYYNLAVWGLTNGVAPGITLTFGLYPITATGSGTTYKLTPSVTAVTGSTVSFSSLAATAEFNAYSGDFAAPAAGYYAVGYAGGSLTSGSQPNMSARLLVRQV